MDNRIFNVNGNEDKQLLDTLKLVFTQRGSTCKATLFDKEKGLILLWWCETGDKGNLLPTDLTAEEIFPIVKSWLKSKQASEVECKGWDANSQHDGSNSMGWRIYCEDWGHVGGISYAICAVKPAYMWYGK